MRKLKAKDCKNCIIWGRLFNGIPFGKEQCGVGNRVRAIKKKDCPLIGKVEVTWR